MRVFDVRLDRLPDGFRASARVASDGGPNGDLWFEASGGVEPPPLEMAAGAFLAACLPTAVWRAEDLRTDAEVDGALLRRARFQAHASARLHHRARTIQIEASPATSVPRPGRVVGASFSGGVDSFHTLMSNLWEDSPTRIGALVTGLGFDTEPDDEEAHRSLMRRLQEVSVELGLRHFAVRTNFRPFFKPHADWNRVTHGAALVAFAFLLSGELHTYLVPASYSVDQLVRWGTHSLLDGGWESGHLRVIVDGWEYHRYEKLTRIADWPLALAYLRVCARGRGAANCGRCEKCLRTMTLLEILGKAGGTFPHPVTADLIRGLKIREVRSLYPWERMREQAARSPQHAWIAAAIGHLARVTRFHAPRRRLVARLRSGRTALDPANL